MVAPALQALAEVDKLSPSHPAVHTAHRLPADKSHTDNYYYYICLTAFFPGQPG